jgi:hypothetical protein
LLALHPKSFGADSLFPRSVELAGLSFKPSHKRLSIYDFRLSIENLKIDVGERVSIENQQS